MFLGGNNILGAANGRYNLGNLNNNGNVFGPDPGLMYSPDPGLMYGPGIFSNVHMASPLVVGNFAGGYNALPFGVGGLPINITDMSLSPFPLPLNVLNKF